MEDGRYAADVTAEALTSSGNALRTPTNKPAPRANLLAGGLCAAVAEGGQPVATQRVRASNRAAPPRRHAARTTQKSHTTSTAASNSRRPGLRAPRGRRNTAMLRLQPIGGCLRRALSSESGAPRHAMAAAAQRRMLLPRKKVKPLRKGISHDNSHRICAHMMGSTHTTDELASILRSRFGAGAVTVFGRSYDYMDESDDTRDMGIPLQT